jgi:hypothetical protein
MKFAPIVPVAYLDLIAERDYHLILPQLVREYPDYGTAYRKAEGFKILDNGEAEGQQGDPELLFNIANGVGVHEIVVPDTLEDIEATIEQCLVFADLAKRHPKYSYMGVIQGSNMGEITSCLIFFQSQTWINRVAFPRIWGPSIHRGLRAAMGESMAEEIQRHFQGVHCLGGNAFAREPVLLHSMPGINPITGIDTSMPAAAALAGIPLDKVIVAPARPEVFFEAEYDAEIHDLMKYNIRVYDSWCGN